MGFLWFSLQTVIVSLNIINAFVMVKCIFFQVRTEFLNII
jgi:hypothetical protein